MGTFAMQSPGAEIIHDVGESFGICAYKTLLEQVLWLSFIVYKSQITQRYPPMVPVKPRQ